MQEEINCLRSAPNLASSPRGDESCTLLRINMSSLKGTVGWIKLKIP